MNKYEPIEAEEKTPSLPQESEDFIKELAESSTEILKTRNDKIKELLKSIQQQLADVIIEVGTLDKKLLVNNVASQCRIGVSNYCVNTEELHDLLEHVSDLRLR